VAFHRRLLVPLASGGILALALALLYVPRLRTPGIVVFLAILLGALTWASPDAAVLAWQAALLGIAVALVTAGLAWFFSGRPVFAPQPASAIVRSQELASTQPQVVRPDRSSQIAATAAVGAAAMEVRP
jgi:hypothetical protein